MKFDKRITYELTGNSGDCRFSVIVHDTWTTIIVRHPDSEKALNFHYEADFQPTMLLTIEGALKAAENLQEFILRLILKRDVPNFYCFKLEADD